MMRDDKKRLRLISISMTICYALVIIFIAVALSSVTITQTDTIVRDNIGALSAELNSQMTMNVNNYLTRCESTATLVFASEENYTYDATDPANDPYEALNTEARISDNLFNLCIMENFVDFGIVYSNNHVVGKISHGTKDKMGDLIYNDLSAMISRPNTQDGWYAGFNDDYKRIYYVKRLNENAVLAVSVYSAELENIVESPDSMRSMAVRLVDKEMNIIYSSIGENNTILPREIKERIRGNVIDPNEAEYIVSANQCGDDWMLVTSIPTQYLLETKNEAQRRIISIAAFAALIALVLDIVISLIFTNPINNIVISLGRKADYDQLTGILNKRSFEDRTLRAIASSKKSVHAMMLIDIDDFKGINDSFGHTAGDDVLSMMGSLIRKSFPESDILGRIGGDEFCVFTKMGGYDNAWSEISSKCALMCESFNGMFADKAQTRRLSCSIGAALFPFDADTFEELYKNADKALYISKRSGKNRFSLFGEKRDAEKFRALTEEMEGIKDGASRDNASAETQPADTAADTPADTDTAQTAEENTSAAETAADKEAEDEE